MDAPEGATLTGQEAQELLDAFGAMAPLLKKSSLATNDGGRDHKKAKTQHKPKETDQHVDLHQVVQQMARLLLRLDVDQNLMRRQDSFVFYMQMEQESVIHVLSAKAKTWHAEVTQQTGQMKTQDWRPLRATLMHTLALTLQHRLMKLYQSQPSDPLFQTALQHRLLNDKGEFFFHRWDTASQSLTQTDQTPVPMERMKRYVDQLVENTMDPANTIKFHSLKPSDQKMTPWLLQISLRCDELQTLLEALVGCKVWCLLGASLKGHTLYQSHQAQQLKTMLGKGKGKSKSNGKGKTHT